MRLSILTHRRADPSFRIRWDQFLPALAAADIETEVRELGAGVGDPGAFDAVVLHRTLLSGRRFKALRKAARRLIYDFDDALCFRPFAPHRSRRRAGRFFRMVGESDQVFAGSGPLARLARLRARKVYVLPSTVDVDRYPPAEEKLPEFTAVWIGQRATLPHLETVREAVLGAGIRLRVIADEAPPGTEACAWSLGTEAQRLAECHVGLMPLPSDPFARGKCGYKLLQYYAARLPAIASPVGTNRTLAAGGALPARTPAEWVSALEALAADEPRREELGRRGRSFVERRYSSSALAERLVRLISRE